MIEKVKVIINENEITLQNYSKVAFGTFRNKITGNSDFHLEEFPLFKLLVMLQCNIWYA